MTIQREVYGSASGTMLLACTECDWSRIVLENKADIWAEHHESQHEAVVESSTETETEDVSEVYED